MSNVIEKIIFPTLVVTSTVGCYPSYSNSNDIFYKYDACYQQTSTKLFSESQPEYHTNISFSKTELSDSDKISIIYNFADNLLKNSTDLDPEISKMVDENFWDLI